LVIVAVKAPALLGEAFGGAVVAGAGMKALNVDCVDVCPWVLALIIR
jgi:hypothetical protein